MKVYDTEGRLLTVEKSPIKYGGTVTRSAVQSIANTTWTQLELDELVHDEQGEWDIDTNYRYDVTESGLYFISGHAGITGIGDQKQFYLDVRVNNSTLLYSLWNSSGASTLRVGLSDIRPLIAGDYVAMWTYHNHGGALNIEAGSIITWLTIRKVG